MKRSGGDAAVGNTNETQRRRRCRLLHKGVCMYGTHNGLSMSGTCNSFGLYDMPISREERERLVFTLDDMDIRIEAGAFLLEAEEAAQAGFINPYDDDTVLVTIR
jgi:hypothetical protein